MRLRFGDGRALWFAAAAVRRPSVLERGLPHTRAALCEALRLRPPAWAFDRECAAAVTLPGGLALRKREILLLSPFALHQDPSVFEHPEAYDPSRFLSSSEMIAGDPWDGGFGKYAYCPFGQGRRRCIGYRFARWEMLVLLATLLARVEVTRPPGYVLPRMEGSVTLRPVGGAELCLHRRDGV